MQYYIIINNEKKYFKSSKIELIGAVVKKLLIKNNINLINYLISLGFKIKKCNICNKEYNHNFYLEFDIKDNQVFISNIQYGKRTGNYNKNYCYGKNLNCPGLKMNSNSAEFISLTLNLNKNEALDYIHKNNKSPFYLINHKNYDDYKKSQSRNKKYFITKYGEEQGIYKYEDFCKKSKYSNSKQYYLDNYGDSGEDLWKQLCAKKAITLTNLINKYGVDDATIKLEHWKATCSSSNEDYIDKYGIDKGLKLINKRTSNRLISLIEKGYELIPKDKKYEYLIYSQLVWDETNYNLLIGGKAKFGVEWKKYKKENKLHLDHMISIKFGFLNMISPNIIGHIENLALVDAKVNLGKKGKCSININELIEKISKYGK